MKSLMQFKVPSHTCNPEELKETQCVMIDISNKKKQLCEKLTSFLILVVSSGFVYLKRRRISFIQINPQYNKKDIQ
jgi:hypothetical protein